MADAQNIAAQDEGGNPTLGRKVFFLSPSYALTEVIASLRSMEYEVYTIDNYRDAKNILIQNPDSICIVTIDSQMHLPMWAAFVASFNSQKDLGNIILGIFSERYRMESIQSAFDSAQLKAGITLYDDQHKLEDVLKNFVQQLERFGAKGRRAHVRVACALDKTAMMYWIETQNCMHQLKLLDISTVAAAVRLPRALSGRITKGMTLHGVTIVIASRQHTVDATVIALQQVRSETIAIMMINGPLAPKTLKSLRDYIFSTLQKQMLTSINGMYLDQEDYRVMADQLKLTKDLGATKAPAAAPAAEGENAKGETDEGEAAGSAGEGADAADAGDEKDAASAAGDGEGADAAEQSEDAAENADNTEGAAGKA